MSGSKEPIQMVDLTGQYQRLKPGIDKSMARVMTHGRFINGPEVSAFASALEQYLEASHVVPCGNGTDALQIALMALDLQPGDEVITPAFSFISALEVIVLLGLRPVLVDVDPGTFNLDSNRVRDALTERTRAIVPVHLFGQGAAMHTILQIAREHNLYVVEDAAQSLGADYKIENRWQKLGTIGHIGCTSFFPSKNLGCFGDGGACITHDDALAAKIKMITTHGAQKKYFSERLGLNSRLDALQASVLLAKLPHLNDFNNRRQQAARYYTEALTEINGLKLPVLNPRSSHVYNQYTVRVTDGRRDALKQHLADAGIPSMVYYPTTLHCQPAFNEMFGRGFSMPVGEMLTGEVLSLPMHTEMTNSMLEYIAASVKYFFINKMV